MAAIKLIDLPRELITHIATFVEALSILNLSRTSKAIRAACWDVLLFKEILQKSQRLNWRHDSLDLEAIADRARKDVSLWARYAVADDQAWVLAGLKDSLDSRKRSINFLPELAIVKHPFLRYSCWSMATHGPFDYLTSHVYCLTVAVLSASDANLGRFHDPGICEYCFPKPRENDPAFLSGEGALWTLCSIAVTLRDDLKKRRSVWPYNDAALVPYIDFPRADRIPSRPLTGEYEIPVPFSSSAVELLNSFKPSLGGWSTWYRRHIHALYTSPDFLTDSAWCGYYTGRGWHQHVDPPMTAIRFQRSHPKVSPEGETAPISADDCVDGVGRFKLRGAIKWDGNVVTISAHKMYDNGPHWDWDCRLTPFGIVGHWGVIADGQFETYGYVWLWKEAWNRGTAEERG